MTTREKELSFEEKSPMFENKKQNVQILLQLACITKHQHVVISKSNLTNTRSQQLYHIKIYNLQYH